MTNKEILEKAIAKAIDGGWSIYYQGTPLWSVRELSAVIIDSPNLHSAEQLIFNKDFSRALWGEELHHETFVVPIELNKRFAGTKDLDIKPLWQYHLQQMVIADDPVQYLGENI
jgi:hypothetical protein